MIVYVFSAKNPQNISGEKTFFKNYFFYLSLEIRYSKTNPVTKEFIFGKFSNEILKDYASFKTTSLCK